jgi:hypothetical protein
MSQFEKKNWKHKLIFEVQRFRDSMREDNKSDGIEKKTVNGRAQNV